MNIQYIWFIITTTGIKSITLYNLRAIVDAIIGKNPQIIQHSRVSDLVKYNPEPMDGKFHLETVNKSKGKKRKQNPRLSRKKCKSELHHIPQWLIWSHNTGVSVEKKSCGQQKQQLFFSTATIFSQSHNWEYTNRRRRRTFKPLFSLTHPHARNTVHARTYRTYRNAFVVVERCESDGAAAWHKQLGVQCLDVSWDLSREAFSSFT